MKSNDTPMNVQDPSLAKLFKQGPSGFFARRKWWLVGILLALSIILTVLPVLRTSEQPAGPRYKTEPAAMGRLVVKVSATGNLQPTNKVEVGSELSGIVVEVMVDDNDRVQKGQVLARLDLSKLKDAVARSRAALAAALAQEMQAKATAVEARAALERFRQAAELSGGKVPSKTEMATAEANQIRAEANLASARASITQARANLQSDETNLHKASIRSPIDGVVLTRKVEPGQTVAAAMQAPVLFILAEDLAKMELQVDVDEADVSQIKPGQQATFTVDAWSGRQFTAVITRVGYGSQTKDGVVSYPTVLAVNNDDLSLRPGMTGTAEIITVTRERALLVPNAALRFSPTATAAQPKPPGGGLLGKLMPRPPMMPPKLQASTNNGAPRVWTLRDGQPVPIELQTGASNGQVTEVLSGPIQAGTALITEVAGG
jgi:HlyD family secretion protein